MRGNSTRGLSLVEVMVAIGLISVSLMLVLSLIPAGIHSAQRAEDIQAAAAWSRALLENAPIPETFPIPPAQAQSDFAEKIGHTKFRARRRLSTESGRPYLFRIEVETTWDGAQRPLKLSMLKYNPAGPLP